MPVQTALVIFYNFSKDIYIAQLSRMSHCALDLDLTTDVGNISIQTENPICGVWWLILLLSPKCSNIWFHQQQWGCRKCIETML